MPVISIPPVNNGDEVNQDLFNTRFGLVADLLNGNLDGDNIAAGGVTAAQLGASAVTTAKLADGAVTGVKTTGIWWSELARTTLSASGDTISVPSFTANKYLKIVVFALPSGGVDAVLRFNNDSGANYAYRFDQNNGSTSSATSANQLAINPTANANTKFIVIDVVNLTANSKMVQGVGSEPNTDAASALPERGEFTGKWANTSAQITRVDVVNAGAGDFASGSEVVVLGHN